MNLDEVGEDEASDRSRQPGTHFTSYYSLIIIKLIRLTIIHYPKQNFVAFYNATLFDKMYCFLIIINIFLKNKAQTDKKKTIPAVLNLPLTYTFTGHLLIAWGIQGGGERAESHLMSLWGDGGLGKYHVFFSSRNREKLPENNYKLNKIWFFTRTANCTIARK